MLKLVELKLHHQLLEQHIWHLNQVVKNLPKSKGISSAEIGKKIKKGDTIMIVEAMKTMNHVPCPIDGTIKEICVEDGQPVEFGQTIAILD